MTNTRTIAVIVPTVAGREETYNAFAGRFPSNPLPSRSGIQGLVDAAASVNPKARSARVEDFFDSRLLENLEKSGFLKSLHP